MADHTDPHAEGLSGLLSPEICADAETPRDRRLWHGALAFYALVVLAQASFQFFINSENWRTAGIAGSDGQAYYAYVRSFVIDRDLDFENELFEYNYNRHGFATRNALPRSPHVPSASLEGFGRIFNRYGLGFSLLHLPFFLIAHALALVLPMFAADGYSLPYQLMTPVGTIAYGLAALATTRRIMLRYARASAATLAALVLFLSFQGAFAVINFWCNPHMQSLLVFNLMLLVAFQIAGRSAGLGKWGALGALTGLGGLLRTEQLAFGLLPAALALVALRRDVRAGSLGKATRRFLLRGSVCLLACLGVFSLQIVAWRIMWGAWFETPMNNPGEHFNWASPVFLKVLFSTRHGLYYWSPVLLIGTIGLVALVLRRKAGAALLCALPVLAALYYVYASWNIWWMGYSFGARQFIALSAFFGVGLAYLLDRFRQHRILPWCVAGALVGWNQIMLWLFLNGHIPRSDGFVPWLPFVRFAELLARKLGF